MSSNKRGPQTIKRLTGCHLHIKTIISTRACLGLQARLALDREPTQDELEKHMSGAVATEVERLSTAGQEIEAKNKLEAARKSAEEEHAAITAAEKELEERRAANLAVYEKLNPDEKEEDEEPPVPGAVQTSGDGAA